MSTVVTLTKTRLAPVRYKRFSTHGASLPNITLTPVTASYSATVPILFMSASYRVIAARGIDSVTVREDFRYLAFQFHRILWGPVAFAPGQPALGASCRSAQHSVHMDATSGLALNSHYLR